EAVGARPRPQASCATAQLNAISADDARVEAVRGEDVPARAEALSSTGEDARASTAIGSQVIAIRGMRRRLIVASNCRISSVSPLAESAITTSPCANIPRSPCKASTGCMYNDGVPVELSVAAILRAMMPLFPMPVTTTRPAQQ